MTHKEYHTKPAIQLRREAEVFLRESAASFLENQVAESPDEIRRKLHDLQVHQIELEMQNDELLRGQMQLDVERARYFDLYDLAPIGYCTVSEPGLILEANRMALSLLGMTRTALLRQRISRFIFKKDQNNYYTLRARLLATGESQSCELRMVDGEGVIFWAHLKATIVPDEGGINTYRLVFNDITERKQSEARRKEALSLLQKIASRIPGMIYQYQLRPDGRACFPFASEAIREIYRVSPEEVREDAAKMLAMLHPNDVGGVVASLQKSAQDLTLWRHEYRVKFADGTVRWLLSNAMPERENDGSILWHGFIIDITERKQIEDRLQLAACVFSHAHEGILIAAADGTIIETNAAFTLITGYRRDEVLGRNPHVLSSGRHDREFYAALWHDLIENGHWHGEIWNRRKNGEVYAELLGITAIHDSQGLIQQYVALFSDITAIKTHEQHLEHIAHYDVLTTLPNRVLLADRLQQAMTQAQRHEQPVAVVLLDLDGFKAVNDRYGHEAGDHLLVTVATRMKQLLREGDTLSRLGGDEFVAVLPDLADVEASVPMITRLLTAVAEPVDLGHLVLQVSASLGVTFYPQSVEIDADQLLRQADQAMYQAKQAGKNRYHVFDAEQDRSLRAIHESLDRIRLALVRHEFVLYYQPKVNMRTGTVIGAEALIRWQHPEKGLLAPAMFLPVIENHPLAIEIGEWVIETALIQQETWQVTGLDLPISVNIGARQLQQQNFVQSLQARLAAHPGVKPLSLELEVLETSALEDLAQVSQVIAACRRIGVQFALDDFGTGYSSLTYLKRLVVTLLKIDQSFVRDMLDDPDDLAILEGVIGLARAFRCRVIAEGVETVAHGEMLLQFGCELAQGYGIARPMPAADLPGWLAVWRPDPRWLHRRTVRRDDLPILFSEVEHRAWVLAIEAFLNGTRDALPLDHHLCRFGAWLVAENLAGRGQQPLLLVTSALHQQMHTLAAELLELQAEGRIPEALARLDELHALRVRLQEYLIGLLSDRQLT
jgi:diguanylate cyclase (GGDEF)-like protein/PAS domain S-box-containing protein